MPTESHLASRYPKIPFRTGPGWARTPQRSGGIPSDVAAVAEVFAAMPLALVRLVALALRHFVTPASDGILGLVLHGLWNAGALLGPPLRCLRDMACGVAHGRAETFPRLDEIGSPVVSDHGHGRLRVRGLEC